jgi:hypothetical protein
LPKITSSSRNVMNGPFIRTVNPAALVAKLTGEKLSALIASMKANPRNYSASYVRAAKAEQMKRNPP